MKHFTGAFGTLLILVGISQCQERSNFKAESVALGMATTADYVMTVRDTSHGLYEAPFPIGSSYLYGKHPTALSTLPMFGGAALTAYVGYRLERTHSKGGRLMGHAVMAVATSIHAEAALQDYKTQR